ncbi:hypothetical protein [Rhizobium sp. RAF56]
MSDDAPRSTQSMTSKRLASHFSGTYVAIALKTKTPAMSGHQTADKL